MLFMNVYESFGAHILNCVLFHAVRYIITRRFHMEILLKERQLRSRSQFRVWDDFHHHGGILDGEGEEIATHEVQHTQAALLYM